MILYILTYNMDKKYRLMTDHEIDTVARDIFSDVDAYW